MADHGGMLFTNPINNIRIRHPQRIFKIGLQFSTNPFICCLAMSNVEHGATVFVNVNSTALNVGKPCRMVKSGGQR